MTCDKKGPGKEEKAKNVEKMTDEELNKVSGGAEKKGTPGQNCWPDVMCDPTRTACKPLTPPWCPPR